MQKQSQPAQTLVIKIEDERSETLSQESIDLEIDQQDDKGLQKPIQTNLQVQIQPVDKGKNQSDQQDGASKSQLILTKNEKPKKNIYKYGFDVSDSEDEKLIGTPRDGHKATNEQPKDGGLDQIAADVDQDEVKSEIAPEKLSPRSAAKAKEKEFLDKLKKDKEENSFSFETQRGADKYIPTFDECISHFDKVKMKHDIQTKIVIPFERYEFVQSLDSPLQQYELITVQISKSVLKAKDEQKDKQDEKESSVEVYCPQRTEEKNCLEKVDIKQMKEQKDKLPDDEEISCFFCQDDLKDKDHQGCKEHKFYVCYECSLDYYVRQKVLSKTSKNYTFEQFYIELLKTQEENEQTVENPEFKTQKTISQQNETFQNRQKLLQQKALQYSEQTQSVQSIKFANIKAAPSNEEFEQCEHAIVSLWTKKDNRFVCQRLIRIDRPLHFTTGNLNFKINGILQINQNGEIYYFCKTFDENKKEKIWIKLLDLQSTQDLEVDNIIIESAKEKDSIEVTDLDAFSLIKEVHTPVSDYRYRFHDEYNNTALPVLLNFKDKKFLIFVSSKVKQQDQWENSSTRSLYFLDLTENDPKIVFWIYNASLFISMDDDQNVTFLRGANSIVTMKWGVPVEPIISSDSSPIQIFLYQRFFATQQTENKNLQQCYQLLDKLQENYDKKELIQARKHYNNQRLTLIFQNGQIFCFQVDQKSIENESKLQSQEINFYGKRKEIEKKLDDKQKDQNNQPQNKEEVASISNTFYTVEQLKFWDDFRITAKFKIKEEENFKQFSGKWKRKRNSWVGHYQSEDGLKFLHFPDFNLKINRYKEIEIQGKEQYTYYEGKPVEQENKEKYKYEITGKIKGDQVSFKEKRVILEETIEVEYKGTINKNQSEITGTFKINNDKEQSFFLQIKDLINVFKFQEEHKSSGSISNILSYTGQFNLRERTLDLEVLTEDQSKKAQYCFIQKNRPQLYTWIDYNQLFLENGSFCQENVDCNTKKLSVFCNIKIKENQDQNSNFTEFSIINIDLDQDLSINSKIEPVQYYCKAPLFFTSIKDNNQKTEKIPKNLFFNLEISSYDKSLKGQLMFQNQYSQSNSIFFFQGEADPNSQKFPFWPESEIEEFQIQYPILAYKRQIPSNHEIAIVNLISNEPQKIINLLPFRFVKFLDSGLFSEQNFQEENSYAQNICVYFLVELDGYLKVMYYKIFPLTLTNPDFAKAKGYQTQHCLHILTGSSPLINEQFSNEKIISAALLTNKNDKQITSAVVVLQMSNQIYYFKLLEQNKDQKFQQIVNSNIGQILKIEMQRGPNQEVFYAKNGINKVVQIACLSISKDGELNETFLKNVSQNNLLAFNIQPQSEGYESYQEFTAFVLLTLDEKGKYQVFKFNNAQLEPKVLFIKDMSKHESKDIQDLISQMKQTQWPYIHGFVRGFNVFFRSESHSFPQILATNSDFYQTQSVFDFNKDTKFKQRKEKSENEVEEKRENKNPKTTQFKQAPWINKCIQSIKDNHRSYFMVSVSLFERRIDLFKADFLANFFYLEFVGQNNLKFILSNWPQYSSVLLNQFDLMQDEIKKELVLLQCTETENFNGVQLWKSYNIIDNDWQPMFFQMKQETDQITKFEFVYNKDEISKQFNKFITSFNSESAIQTEYFDHYLQRINQIISLNPDKFIRDDTDKDKNKKQKLDKQKQKESFSSMLKLSGLTEDHKGPDLCGEQFELQLFNFKANDHITGFFVLHNKNFDQIVSTERYLVFKQEKQLFYIEKSVIYQSEPTSINIWMEDIKADVFLKNFHPQMFTKIDLITFLPEKLVQSGFTIRNVYDSDLNIAEKHEIRKNVVQIDFQSVSIIWDLYEKKEVIFVDNPSQFLLFENYVQTGIQPASQYYWRSKIADDMLITKQNLQKTLFIQTQYLIKEYDKVDVLFKNYCELDLLDVINLKEISAKDKTVKQIDFETMLAVFDGQTFFEIFQQEPNFLDLIYDQIKEQDLIEKKSIDKFGEQTENLIIRRLFWTLLLPIIDKKSKAVQRNQFFKVFNKFSTGKYEEGLVEDKRHKNDQCRNIMQTKLSDHEDQILLNPLIKLLMYSQEHKLSNLVARMSDFSNLLNSKSHLIQRFMGNCSIKNSYIQAIKPVLWNRRHKMITFGSDTSLLNQEIIQKFIKIEQKSKAPIRRQLLVLMIKMFEQFFSLKKTETDSFLIGQQQTTPIEVEILDIEWLSDNVGDLYLLMADLEEDLLFANGLIIILIGQQNYTNQVFSKVFIVYLIYMITCLGYMSFYVPKGNPDSFLGNRVSQQGAWCRILIILLGSTFLFIEFVQFYHQLLKYFEDSWNWFYTTSIILNLYIVFSHGFSYYTLDFDRLIAITSIAIILQWFVSFYWMRLVEELAFFVTMINSVFQDIGAFIVMFLVCIIMFANAVYVLNRANLNQNVNVLASDEFIPIFENSFNVEFIDSILFFYRLGLGDFNTDNFGDQNPLIWIYFILSTVFCQLVFVNMLVGIMNNTFTVVTGDRDRNALMEQTKMYADYLWAISFTKKFEKKRYLYVIKPQQEEEEHEVQDGVKVLQRSTKRMEKDLSEIKQDSQEKAEKLYEQNNDQMQKIENKIQDVDEKLTKLTLLLEQLRNQDQE